MSEITLSELNAKRFELENKIVALADEFEQDTGVKVTGITAERKRVDISSHGELNSFIYDNMDIFVDLAWWAK